MPKAYTESEKTIIRARLIGVGQRLINALGVRRLTVDDITREAGISKGGFYNFFPSREDFILSVFESWEDLYRAKLLAGIQESGLPLKERWKNLFLEMVQMLEKQPGLAQFQSADLDLLMARLTPDRLSAHQARDRAVIQEAMQNWLSKGLINHRAAAVLPGLIAAIFSAAIHRQDFKEVDFMATIEFIAAALAEKMPGDAL